MMSLGELIFCLMRATVRLAGGLRLPVMCAFVVTSFFPDLGLCIASKASLSAQAPALLFSTVSCAFVGKMTASSSRRFASRRILSARWIFRALTTLAGRTFLALGMSFSMSAKGRGEESTLREIPATCVGRAQTMIFKSRAICLPA